jgi:hypothetical protein
MNTFWWDLTDAIADRASVSRRDQTDAIADRASVWCRWLGLVQLQSFVTHAIMKVHDCHIALLFYFDIFGSMYLWLLFQHKSFTHNGGIANSDSNCRDQETQVFANAPKKKEGDEQTFN